MEQRRKIHTDWTALGICGIVFSFIGLVYILVGIGLHGVDEDLPLFLGIFGGLGLLFFLLGAVFLYFWLKKLALQQKAYDSGDYFTCPITRISVDRSVQVNRNSLQYAVAEVSDPSTRTVHVYRSRGMRYCPEALVGTPVKIYRDRENPKSYYMDIDEILPKVIVH